MEITIENLTLSIDSDVLFDEIRDDITPIIEDAVSEAVEAAVSDAVSEELRYNFDIDDHIDYDIVADEVKRRNDDGSAEHHAANSFLKQLEDPEVCAALRLLMTPKVLSEKLDTPLVRDLLMRLIADQLVFGQPVEIASTEGMR